MLASVASLRPARHWRWRESDARFEGFHTSATRTRKPVKEKIAVVAGIMPIVIILDLITKRWALEALVMTADTSNPELEDMTRRFVVALVLTLPVMAISMGGMLPGRPLHGVLSARWQDWIQVLLATPIVLWAGRPFFERGYQQAARWKKWKAIRPKPDAALQLYDLSVDLGETTDLAALQPEIVRKFEDYLRVARTGSKAWPLP